MNRGRKKYITSIIYGIFRAVLTPPAFLVFGFAALYMMLDWLINWLKRFVTKSHKTVEFDPGVKQGPVDSGASPTQVKDADGYPSLDELYLIPAMGLSFWAGSVVGFVWGESFVPGRRQQLSSNR